eukprot:CAMPEP_0206580294 /NCGR_PEP_ID=MMETSP0325_2-20121206/33063_1 /ASSEMBLY_ACC=CAM_ASM_000347 /TAXON_ID=2866 /ORGANISM="Crypthecodinium cohnii, Strain Seligo" /LENGTH=622 /DNA_ID=CAMNT_0054086277 /DNA_START=356 /DNA_END=2221 /DNA_ORIENTATION=+
MAAPRPTTLSTAAASTFTPRVPMSARGPLKVPFLPGYSSNPLGGSGDSVKSSGHKKMQTLTYGPGGAHTTIKTSDIPRLDLKQLETLMDPRNRLDMSTPIVTHEERQAQKDSARNSYRPGIPPAWLKHDRQVLRFAAYFQEPVHENPKENFRVRHCTVYFYLEDGTMMVTEPRIENSGIPQGTFVKRHRIPKNDGSFYTFQDLATAETLEIYSRAFRLYDCDDFTRDFYESGVGIRLKPREEPPLDNFRATQLQELDLQSQPTSRDILEGKEYNELAVGGNRKNAKLQQYIENDRKVLCFKVFWDDDTHYGTRMYYTLHYHLADDTVEILENLARNSGRDPYPVFWRRSPLRKNPHVSPAPGMLEPEPDLYKPEDLVVGQSIRVYNRDIYLYDCDDFTREFYRGYMGIEQDSQEIIAPEPQHVQMGYPPHSGLGSEEDALASCLHLTPRPPRKDEIKLMSQEGQALRFEGRMANGVADDSARRFVVAVYVSDDSVCVWEKKQRNSGYSSGKFALKSKKRTPDGTWYKAQDFFLGAVVVINAMPFHLLNADDATISYMEAHKDEYPVSDERLILSKIRQAKSAIQEACGKGPDRATLEELANLTYAAGLDLSSHELLTLIRKY